LTEDSSIISTVDNDDNQNNNHNNNTRRTATAAADNCGFAPLRISPNDIVRTERERDVRSNGSSKNKNQTLYEENNSETRSTNSDPPKMFCGAKKDPLDLIDLFISNLCVGPCAPKQPTSTSQREQKQKQKQEQQRQQQPQLQRPQPVPLKKRRTQVVYPIAKYATASNSLDLSVTEQQQEQQRRRPMQEEEHLQFFRPVHAADAEHVHSAAKKPKLDLS
jgi:hypothetical protein